MTSSTSPPTLAEAVYHTDTLSTIIQFTSWMDLIRCYSLDSSASDLVLPEIRRRLFAVVSLFVPEDDVLEFFDILRDSDGLICRSTARHILLPYEPHKTDRPVAKSTPLPNDLNVLVARDRSELFFAFFEKLAYEYSLELPDSLYSSYVTKLEVFSQCRPDGSVSRVTMSLCKDSALSALLKSPTTAEMNTITYEAVYSLYPRLTYANEGLIVGRVTDAGVDVDRLRVGGGVRLFTDNAHWTKPCDWYCPMRRRKTYGDAGAARYRWSSWSDDLAVYNEWGNSVVDNPARAAISEWDLLYSAMETWTILDRCVNPHCHDAAKYNQRSQYVPV